MQFRSMAASGIDRLHGGWIHWELPLSKHIGSGGGSFSERRCVNVRIPGHLWKSRMRIPAVAGRRHSRQFQSPLGNWLGHIVSVPDDFPVALDA